MPQTRPTAIARARAYSLADSTGSSPGNVSAVSASKSTIRSGIGSEEDKQRAQVVVGEDLILTGKNMLFEANNSGDAVAAIHKGSSFAAGSISSSSQPTESWYETGVAIGFGASLRATETMTITALERMGGQSHVNGDQTGILFSKNFCQNTCKPDLRRKAGYCADHSN